MLTRAVGVEPQVDIDLVTDSPVANDCYVLCSDGLTRMVPDELIAQIVQGGQDLEETAKLLIAVANQRGGKDNVTVVLVRVMQPKELAELLGPPARP
jgi:protein phosphatase